MCDFYTCNGFPGSEDGREAGKRKKEKEDDQRGTREMIRQQGGYVRWKGHRKGRRAGRIRRAKWILNLERRRVYRACLSMITDSGD